MLTDKKSLFVSVIIFSVLLIFGFVTQPVLSQENQSVEEKIAELQDEIENLKDRVPKIGYINRQEAFSVYYQMVETERQAVAELEKQMEELNTQAEEGEIGESEYKRQRDLLRAKHLQARIEVNVAILETMIEARGFSGLTERLESLKSQSEPMRKTVDNLISEIKDYAVSPQQVSETLNKVENEQLNRLDNILTNLAQTKITRVVYQVAEEKDYDLVIERQNVITYRKKTGAIDNLTESIKTRLKEELQPG